MNESTEYVRMHVINFEPTYLALMEAVKDYQSETLTFHEAREELAAAVHTHREAMGLRASDLGDDVEYGEMIDFEVGEE
jgi:hypothetical protein